MSDTVMDAPFGLLTRNSVCHSPPSARCGKNCETVAAACTMTVIATGPVCAPRLSVSVTEKLNVPVCALAALSTPVLAPRVSHAGSPVALQVYGGTPPIPARVVKNGIPVDPRKFAPETIIGGTAIG